MVFYDYAQLAWFSQPEIWELLTAPGVQLSLKLFLLILFYPNITIQAESREFSRGRMLDLNQGGFR